MDKFCKFCGVEHTAPEYPKHCKGCSNITWINPTPVAVLLQPVYDPNTDRTGIIVGQRGINPKRGEWGLIGGFIDPKDANVEEGARREFFEETGLEAPHASKMQLFSSMSDSRHLLVFVRCFKPLELTALEGFVKNHECTAIRPAWEPEQLCFDAHTEALRYWFQLRGFKTTQA